MTVEKINVMLPDGKREYERGVPLAEIARDAGEPDAVAAEVEGVVRDLSAALEGDASVRFLRFDDPEGREVYWHTSAHLLAQAVTDLFPEAHLAIGPSIEDGFYYDFDIGRPFSPEDLERIEARMRDLVQRDQPLQHLLIPRDEAIRMYRERGEKYKLELLEGIPDDPVSFYRHDGFLDLCRGPHLPNTNRINAVKVLSSSGAYWRGDEHREMLQRIYAISFPDQQQLNEYLHRLEEARRRDHRRLGRELKLFVSSEEVGQGLPLWLPRGATVRRILERYIVDLELSLGYEHVYTPPLARIELYQQSGHWEHYRENMYPPMEIDEERLVLRPMICPHHFMIYKAEQHSYRDLPIRIAELGLQHRYERSGVLTGLSRVRGMTLNDAHLFVREDQLKHEFKTVVELVLRVYRDFGITEFWHRISLRDPKDRVTYGGDDAMWQRAEDALRDAMNELGLPYVEAVGEASFYGPKLDVQVTTAQGKDETLSTVQIDFFLPERFDLEYIGEDGQPHRPVVIHRGVVSTMERMVAFLIELYAGAFPMWLAPEQVRVLPIADRHVAYAERVRDRLHQAGLRVEVDASREKVQKKIRDAQLMKVPYMLVVGDKESDADSVSVRERSKGDLGAMPLDEFAAHAAEEARVPGSPPTRDALA